jgi:chromosome segregation protein
MLRIEKLFLQGFKSFNDPTEIIFDEEGITAVVGPNGCGKSNVADAISWVIGEQRAKALRGGKMEDVIFQGSRNRPASGMAEVALTMVVRETFEIRGETGHQESEALRLAQASLEEASAAIEASTAQIDKEAEPQLQIAEASVNPQEQTEPAETSGHQEAAAEATAEVAPTEAAVKKKRKTSAPPTGPRIYEEGERITVARRLYRTGESEYEMNGRACRLRDVQDLFSGTGLGGAHYAIIEQGRIGQVLSAKPLDRRALIEEAAGIAKFKMRQHTAELKLEASRQNLSRITDILNEIDRQQNSLKRQAAKARRYQKLRQEMRDLMRAVYVVDYRSITRTLTDIETTLSETSTRESEFVSSAARLEDEHNQALQVSRSAEEVLNEVRQIAAGIDLETERARQQHTYLNEQLQTLGSRSAQSARDQAAIGERSRFIELEIARLRDELQKIEAEINEENRTLTEAETDHRSQIDRDVETEVKLEEARKAVYEHVTHLERWRQLKRQFTDAVDRCQSRLEGLTLESERARTQAQTAEEQYTRLSESLEEASNKQHYTGNQLSDVSMQLAEMRRAFEDGQAKWQSLQKDLSATEHRLKSLHELDDKRAYFSEAVQALMNRDPQSSRFKTLGTLADYVHVSSDNETLIETALKEELQYVVVPGFDDALEAISFLKTEGAGRATFLVTGLHGGESAGLAPDGSGSEPQRRTLDSLLGLKPEFAEAFKLAMPGLAGAVVVDDTTDAINVSASNEGPATSPISFTMNGERVIGGRLISGGSRSEKGIGVLALKRELSELSERIETLEAEAGITESELGETKSRITSLEETRNQLDTELRQLDKQLAVLREQTQQCERERERTSTHIRVVEQETRQAEEELREFEAKLQHAGGQNEEAERVRAEAEQVVELAQVEMAELRRRAEARSQDLSQRRAEFAASIERRRGFQNDIRRLESESADLEDRLQRIRLEAVAANDQAGQAEVTLFNLTDQLNELISRQKEKSAEVEQRVQALAAAREKLETIDLELKTARESASMLREQRAQKEIERAKLTSDLEHLINTCHTELAENIVEVCERLEKNRLALVEQPEMQQEPQAQALSVTSDSIIDEDSDTDDYPDLDISFWTVPEDFDLQSAKTRLEDLREKIDGLGPINMMALEELTEIETRFDFLAAQKSDIERAIADTQSAISEIKKRSREKFHDSFHAINENFKKMFVELFGGGQGEMRLIDETDILESGIEIIAQPPGKRLQNILLLSGGEKAMAALSLVLAIFKYRPSPFCLLDEVDAPLDEVNIGRFADKVVEMSANTQFMIITHSKRTMEAAKTLYGVTMEDPGVSKLISVKLT